MGAAVASDWAWLAGENLNPRKLFQRNFLKGQSTKNPSKIWRYNYGIQVLFDLYTVHVLHSTWLNTFDGMFLGSVILDLYTVHVLYLQIHWHNFTNILLRQIAICM